MSNNPNTQLPDEVVEQIKTNAALRCDRNEGKDDNSFRNGYYSGYVSGATTYATKLHQVEQATEDKIDKALHAERNRIQAKLTASETEWAKKLHQLQQENEELKRENKKMKDMLKGMVNRFVGISETGGQPEDLTLITEAKKFLYGE